MTTLDYHRYIGYARVSAAKAGLSIEFERDNVQPRTYGDRLVVQQPNALWSKEEWDKWWYRLEHEIGHEREVWREWKDVMEAKKLSHGNILGAINNLNSDNAQEHDRYGQLRGVDIRLGEGRRNFILKDQSPDLTTTPPGKQTPEPAFSAAWVYDAMCREEWNPAMAGASSKFTLTPEIASLLDKLKGWGKSASSCTNEWEVYDFSKEMLDVMGLDSDEEERKMQDEWEKQTAEGVGEGDEGEATEATEAKDDEADSGTGDGKVEEDTAKKKVAYDQYFEHVHGKTSTSDLTIDYNGYRGDGVYVPRKMQVKRNIPISENSRMFANAKSSSGFANRIRKMLQIYSATRYEAGKKSGKLCSKNLHRAKAGNPYIFKRKADTLNLKDTEVMVLIDFSGSMGGRKIGHACHAAVLLNDAIAKIGVPIEIRGFSDESDGPLDFRIKEFGERVTTDTLIGRFSTCAKSMWNNADGENILQAWHDISRRPSKRKVIVVLSDGSPASSSRYDDDDFLTKVVKDVEASGVSIYGIGICDNNVERYYTHRCVITKADELEHKLLDVVKRQILNRS